MVSGNYEEDFEVYKSFLQTKLEEEEDDEEQRDDASEKVCVALQLNF